MEPWIMLFNSFSGLHVYLYRQPTDMRKSFEGLSGIVSSALDANPLSGDVFVFLNKRRDRIKLMLWDRDGFWIFYKRLEKGTFQLPAIDSSMDAVELSYDMLWLMIAGIDSNFIKRRPRYVLKNGTTC
ncbi:IS66 family insertion sequence element accessory protein TnpB [bacterium]|nr:IS66 family insertion sequence element accessory protein TnpB [bacterium]